MHDSSAPDEEEDPHPEPGFSNESRGLKMGSVEVDDDDLSPAAVRQELIKRIKNGEGSAAASDSKVSKVAYAFCPTVVENSIVRVSFWDSSVLSGP